MPLAQAIGRRDLRKGVGGRDKPGHDGPSQDMVTLAHMVGALDYNRPLGVWIDCHE